MGIGGQALLAGLELELEFGLGPVYGWIYGYMGNDAMTSLHIC